MSAELFSIAGLRGVARRVRLDQLDLVGDFEVLVVDDTAYIARARTRRAERRWWRFTAAEQPGLFDLIARTL
jgi:hypothetical protein